MKSMTARMSIETGHFSTHPGLGHSMQRIDSCLACSGAKPTFTSRKLRERTPASCSGILCRGSLIRSLLGSGFLLIEHPRLNRGALAPYDDILSQLPQLRFRICLQTLDAGPLLFAIHGVSLYQNFEVHL